MGSMTGDSSLSLGKVDSMPVWTVGQLPGDGCFWLGSDSGSHTRVRFPPTIMRAEDVPCRRRPLQAGSPERSMHLWLAP